MPRDTRINRATVYPADALTARLVDVLYPATGGAADLAVANANTTYQPEDAPAAVMRLTGTLTANRTYLLTRDEGSPALFCVENATTGGYDTIIKVSSGGATVTVKNGQRLEVFTRDGTNLILFPVPLTAQMHTADYSIIANDSGKLFTNTGAGATVIFTLPSTASHGLNFRFLSCVDKLLRVDGNGNNIGVAGILAGAAIETAIINAALHLIWDGGQWRDVSNARTGEWIES